MTYDAYGATGDEPARKTLRDEMAMAALTGWLACWPAGAGVGAESDKDIADAAYRMADAMMKARG